MTEVHPSALAEMKRPSESASTARPGSGLEPSATASRRTPVLRNSMRQGGFRSTTSATTKSRAAGLVQGGVDSPPCTCETSNKGRHDAEVASRGLAGPRRGAPGHGTGAPTGGFHVEVSVVSSGVGSRWRASTGGQHRRNTSLSALLIVPTAAFRDTAYRYSGVAGASPPSAKTPCPKRCGAHR